MLILKSILGKIKHINSNYGISWNQNFANKTFVPWKSKKAKIHCQAQSAIASNTTRDPIVICAIKIYWFFNGFYIHERWIQKVVNSSDLNIP